MAFVFKVFTLFVKTASKPLASRFQSYVLAHETLRPAVLTFAQVMHRLDFAINRVADGKALRPGKVFVAKLDDERAMELAGKVVSEGFVLAVGVGILAWEYNKNTKKDLDKKLKEESFKRYIEDQFFETNRLLVQREKQTEAVLAAIRQHQDSFEQRLQDLQDGKLQQSSSMFFTSRS